MAIILILCVAGYWLSQKLFLGYLHAVVHEERYLRNRSGSTGDGGRPLHHLGPKFFVALDLLFVGGVMFALWRLVFARNDGFPLSAAFEACVLFSVLSILWLMRARHQLEMYYTHMARVFRRPLHRLSQPMRKGLSSTLLICAATPLVLALAGVDAAVWAGRNELLLLMFAGFFVVPHFIQSVLIIRDVGAVRRSLYEG